MSLDGKVVLVTGGSSGIGRAAVLAFGRAGARVAFAGRRQQPGEEVESLARTEGHDAHYIRADVARTADAERLVALTVARYGRIDAAFNNAATEDGAFALTADFTEEQFDTAMQANLKSMKFELRQMLSQSSPGGTIVNTSSVNGLGGAPGGALYSAAKAGVLALTKSAAQEYATRGIRVNALVAGAFRTPMLERVFDAAGGGTAEGRSAVEASMPASTPWAASGLRRKQRPRQSGSVAMRHRT